MQKKREKKHRTTHSIKKAAAVAITQFGNRKFVLFCTFPAAAATQERKGIIIYLLLFDSENCQDVSQLNFFERNKHVP